MPLRHKKINMLNHGKASWIVYKVGQGGAGIGDEGRSNTINSILALNYVGQSTSPQ